MEIGHRQPEPWRNPSLQFSANPAVFQNRQTSSLYGSHELEGILLDITATKILAIFILHSPDEPTVLQC